MKTSIRELFDYLYEHESGKSSNTSHAVGFLVSKLQARFADLDPFQARVVVNIFLHESHAPRRIIQMAINEISKMIDVSIAVRSPSQRSELMKHIEVATNALNALMDDPEFGGVTTEPETEVS